MHRHSYTARITAEMSVGTTMEQGWAVGVQDLDMDMRLALAKGAHGALIRQIEADAALLARMGVMDYSLLLGVHYPKWGDQAWYPPGGNLTVRPAF